MELFDICLCTALLFAANVVYTCFLNLRIASAILQWRCSLEEIYLGNLGPFAAPLQIAAVFAQSTGFLPIFWPSSSCTILAFYLFLP